MSLCTVCGRCLCDHTLEERGQTIAEAVRALNNMELEALRAEREGSLELIKLAKENAHFPVQH